MKHKFYFGMLIILVAMLLLSACASTCNPNAGSPTY